MATRVFRCDWGVTGVNLYFRVEDHNGATLIARTNAGVVEDIPGIYKVTIATWDVDWEGIIIWDDGSNLPSGVAIETFTKILLANEGELVLADSQNFNNTGQVTTLPVELVDNRSGTGSRVVIVTVRETVSGDPISGVEVRFTIGPHQYYYKTGIDGVAQFALDDGNYTLSASKTGYNFGVENRLIEANINFAIYMDFLEPKLPSTQDPGWFGDDGYLIDDGVAPPPDPVIPVVIIPSTPMRLPAPRPPSQSWFN